MNLKKALLFFTTLILVLSFSSSLVSADEVNNNSFSIKGTAYTELSKTGKITNNKDKLKNVMLDLDVLDVNDTEVTIKGTISYLGSEKELTVDSKGTINKSADNEYLLVNTGESRWDSDRELLLADVSITNQDNPTIKFTFYNKETDHILIFESPLKEQNELKNTIKSLFNQDLDILPRGHWLVHFFEPEKLEVEKPISILTNRPEEYVHGYFDQTIPGDYSGYYIRQHAQVKVWSSTPGVITSNGNAYTAIQLTDKWITDSDGYYSYGDSYVQVGDKYGSSVSVSAWTSMYNNSSRDHLTRVLWDATGSDTIMGSSATIAMSFGIGPLSASYSTDNLIKYPNHKDWMDLDAGGSNYIVEDDFDFSGSELDQIGHVLRVDWVITSEGKGNYGDRAFYVNYTIPFYSTQTGVVEVWRSPTLTSVYDVY